VTRDGQELSPNLELVAIDIVRAVQKWKKDEDGNLTPDPSGTRVLGPGEKFPDVAKLNEETPKEEWIKGRSGQLEGPYQNQYLLYLLDPATMSKYSYPTATVGGGIAIRDLREKVMWMRKFRGPDTYAVVTLSDCFMKTKHGGRQRPNLLIKRWVGMGGGGGRKTLEHKPSPPTSPASPAAAPLEARDVTPPTISEELNDKLPF
jgi:hypothetical protein